MQSKITMLNPPLNPDTASSIIVLIEFVYLNFVREPNGIWRLILLSQYENPPPYIMRLTYCSMNHYLSAACWQLQQSFLLTDIGPFVSFETFRIEEQCITITRGMDSTWLYSLNNTHHNRLARFHRWFNGDINRRRNEIVRIDKRNRKSLTKRIAGGIRC